MSEEINKDKVTLSDDLISMIIGFIIRSPFHNTIPIEFLFNDVEEYREKKKVYNIYSNICNSCKSFYSEKYKDSYIIFNKEYSKKYNDSKEFREEVSKKIDITKLLVYSNELHKYYHVNSRKKISCDILVNFEGKKKYLQERGSILEFNILKSTYIEVLTFMKLQNTEVRKISKMYVFEQINSFVRKEKIANNSNIFVEGYNKCFRLVGDLKILFDFIKQQMILRGDLENPAAFPDHIKYTEILTYLKYCFPVKITNNV